MIDTSDLNLPSAIGVIQRLEAELEGVNEYIKMLQGRMSPHLADKHPLVLFFASEKDKQEFAELIKRAHPNLVAKKL